MSRCAGSREGTGSPSGAPVTWVRIVCTDGREVQRWLGAAPEMQREWFEKRWGRACEVLGYIGLAVELGPLYQLFAVVHAISDFWRELLAKWPLEVG